MVGELSYSFVQSSMSIQVMRSYYRMQWRLCSLSLANFGAPTGLPHPRSHDHRIPLQLGAGLICVRLYRYPYFQKQEIERLVEELLS